jgi:hypothetical protein
MTGGAMPPLRTPRKMLRPLPSGQPLFKEALAGCFGGKQRKCPLRKPQKLWAHNRKRLEKTLLKHMLKTI